MGLAAKVWIARQLCSPGVGRALRALLGGRVRRWGCRYDLRSPAVRPEAVAAVFFGLYESAEARFVRRFLPAECDVVELGASLGVVSSLAARRLAPGRAMTCVEANRALLGVLEANVRRNAPEVRLQVVHGAIDCEGDGPEVAFARAGDHLASHLAREGGVGVERVPRVWLRDLLTAVQRGPRVLICDVEGAEAGILERDAAALQAFSLVIVELHQSTFAGKRVDVGGLVAQFEGIGFEVAASHGPVRVFRARARAAAPA